MTVEQFAYLKDPSKIRAAIINEGGPRLSVDAIERKLRGSRRGVIRDGIGDPTDKDGEFYAPVGLLAAKRLPAHKPPAKLAITEEERARIAAIAAKIPNRVVDKPRRVMAVKLDPTAANFTDQLIRFCLRKAKMKHKTLFRPRRNGRAAAVASLIAVILRDFDARKYSYPRIARALRRGDHTTIIYSASQWPVYAERWPELKAIYSAAMRELREGGE